MKARDATEGGIQRNSKHEMDLTQSETEGLCEGEERGFPRLRQPQMAVGEKLGSQTYNTWALHFVSNMNLKEWSIPPKPLKKSPPIQHWLKLCHPRRNQLSHPGLQPTELQGAWYTDVVSSHQTWGNKLQAGVKHQHDTPWHQARP